MITKQSTQILAINDSSVSCSYFYTGSNWNRQRYIFYRWADCGRVGRQNPLSEADKNNFAIHPEDFFSFPFWEWLLQSQTCQNQHGASTGKEKKKCLGKASWDAKNLGMWILYTQGAAASWKSSRPSHTLSPGSLQDQSGDRQAELTSTQKKMYLDSFAT